MVMTASHVANMPTIADFLTANPNADPKELLQVVVAETSRIKEENLWMQQEYRTTSEVELDENLNFKPKTMAQLQRLARMYAESGLVPDHYKNNVAGCAIGIQMALRMHVDILTFLQCSFVHKGKIGIEAKLAMARLNTSGKIKGRVTYEIERGPDGKPVKCTANAIDADTGETLSQMVDWSMVTGEGWDRDNGTQKSKWKTLPDLMFQYRAGIFLARVHYPDVLLGMYTIDELEDMARSNGDAAPAAANGSAASDLAALSERLGAAPKATKPKKAAKAPETEPADEDPVETGADHTQNDTHDTQEPAEPVTKPEVKETAAKHNPRAGSAKETPAKSGAQRGPVGESPAAVATPPAAASPPRTTPKGAALSIDGLKGYMQVTYDADIADFDLDKIASACTGYADFRGLIDSIFKRRHPEFESYLAPHLRAGESNSQDDVNQEQPGDSGGENQDAPDCIREPIKRPKKLCLMATDYEKTIIGKRSPEQILAYLQGDIKGNPHLESPEKAYLLDLGKRRAYQLEHSITPTDKLPK